MPAISVADNEYITLKCIPEKQLITHIIHKPIGSAELREALLAGTAALKEHKATKWLSDDRLNGPLAQEDVEWGFNIWNRLTIDAGWKYWALVVQKEVIAAGSMTQTIEALFDMGLRVMLFESAEEAMEWLDSRQ